MRILIAFMVGLRAIAPVQAQQPPQWKAVHDLRIGDVDDPNLALTWMIGIALSAPTGSFYSLHYPEKLIRAFDANGRLVAKFGRSGNGPGEFNNPAYIGWRGDSLWIYDSVQRRFNLYDAIGRPLNALTIIPAGTMRTSPRALLSDGTVLAQLPLGATPEEQRQGTSERSALVRLAREGGLRDTMAIYESKNTFVRINDPNGKWGMVFGNPFGTSTLYTVAPDGAGVYLVERPTAANAREGFFTVRRIPVTGGPAVVQRYSYVPQRVTRAHVDSAFAPTLKSLSESPSGGPGRMTRGDAQRALEQAVAVPTYHPPIQEVIPGTDGTLWLRRENLFRATNSWVVLDAGGRMIGTVELPRQLRVLAATRTSVLAEEHDDLQVPYITRYRVGPATVER